MGATDRHGDEYHPIVPTPAWWQEVEKTKRTGKPVIFVTLGTVARNLEALLYPSLDALALTIATAGKPCHRVASSASAKAGCKKRCAMVWCAASDARGAWAGAGRDLKRNPPKNAQISTAVNDILHNPGVKAEAMRLSVQYYAQNPATGEE